MHDGCERRGGGGGVEGSSDVGRVVGEQDKRGVQIAGLEEGGRGETSVQRSKNLHRDFSD